MAATANSVFAGAEQSGACNFAAAFHRLKRPDEGHQSKKAAPPEGSVQPPQPVD
jgi:hypothetical protein